MVSLRVPLREPALPGKRRGHEPVAGLVLNGSGGVANSQCTVSGSGSFLSAGSNTLTLTLALNFTQSFAGNRVLYLAARDNADTANSGWQAMGLWTVP